MKPRPTRTSSHLLPESLDEKVVKLHILALGAELTVLTRMARFTRCWAQHDLFRYWKEIKACKADAVSETDVSVSSTGSCQG